MKHFIFQGVLMRGRKRRGGRASELGLFSFAGSERAGQWNTRLFIVKYKSVLTFFLVSCFQELHLHLWLPEIINFDYTYTPPP